VSCRRHALEMSVDERPASIDRCCSSLSHPTQSFPRNNSTWSPTTRSSCTDITRSSIDTARSFGNGPGRIIPSTTIRPIGKGSESYSPRSISDEPTLRPSQRTCGRSRVTTPSGVHKGRPGRAVGVGRVIPEGQKAALVHVIPSPAKLVLSRCEVEIDRYEKRFQSSVRGMLRISTA
jgi:hypothetical protein